MSEVTKEVRGLLARLKNMPQPELLQPEAFAIAVAKFYRGLLQEGLDHELAKELTMAYIAGG